jgi:TIR domain/Pentapeptide repeats (8 copies)
VNFNFANLQQADFRRADLEESHFHASALHGVNFDGANLFHANLSEAILHRASLHLANLRAANLAMAVFTGADLTQAILRATSLALTNFHYATLSGADFTSAVLNVTNFTGSDLSGASGLETVLHTGPSSVGVDTIYKSKGRIPEVFLRGCGVPDDMIAYIRSIAGAMQFYSCFISYSTKDQEFADRLYADLQAKGVRCWFAPHDIRGGRKIHEQIDEAIRLHDKLLLILSEHSMSSDWVQTEIAKARKREAQEKRQMLFPVALVPYDVPADAASFGVGQDRLQRRSPGEAERPVTIKEWECFDADRGKDSAREIREYFIPDFSNWKDHDSYQKAFTRLVADLKAQS